MHNARRILTIGHSTHPIARFVDLLRAQEILGLADIRAQPGSRRQPQFNRAALEPALAAHGIEYRWLPGLGGKRTSAAADSPNTAWRDPQLRAYADHTASAEFAAAAGELLEWALQRRVAYMCAEGDPARCHRQILSDVLRGRGWEVVHVLPDGRTRPHVVPASARFTRDGHLTYPADGLDFDRPT